MAVASMFSLACLQGKKEGLSKELERKSAKEMIRDSIHLTAVQPPLKKIEIKKKKRWWQLWR